MKKLSMEGLVLSTFSGNLGQGSWKVAPGISTWVLLSLGILTNPYDGHSCANTTSICFHGGGGGIQGSPHGQYTLNC